MVEKKKPRFLRRDWIKKSKLGRKRKKKQIWRKPKGRHNKLRLQTKGKSRQPAIGFGADRITRGNVKGLKPILVNNLKELLDTRNKKNVIVVISKNVGTLKKMNMVKKALEMKINILNVDAEKFLKKVEKTKEEKKKLQEIRAEKRKKQESKKADSKSTKSIDKNKEAKPAVKDKVVKTEGKIKKEKQEEEKKEIDMAKKEVHKHIKEDLKSQKPSDTHVHRKALEK